MAEKLTKQGVRDLNHLKAVSRGKKLEMPPPAFMCNHSTSHREGRIEICDECGESLIQ